ncbi:hypothetical protein [Hyphomicrobium sp. 2TAF46]|uniref:hypothetical protein n=1 Tax=Hyphomicrobium sp. 2TAF46 TaxID=3233019 RepID=UPI000F9005AA|nr:MAG: hypothetical protein EKK38_18705 [Hyphomicrobium sp.]
MPPVMFLAIVGIAGLAGYRLLSAMSRNARSSTRKAEATANVRDLGNLEWDEAAGVYKPRVKREN